MDISIFSLVLVLIIILIYWLSKNDKNPLLYEWDIKKGFDKDNYSIFPWEQVFQCNFSDMKLEELDKDFKEILKNIALEKFDIKNFKKENIIIIDYYSPKKTWDNLAGRGGYLFILKKEMKQLYYMETIMS